MTPAIEVLNLEKSYGSNAVLRGVDLTVRRGEVFGLLGRNGAGKTTLVECMQGLRRRAAGSVSVLGIDPERDHRALHRIIGSQLQSCGLPSRLRVGEAVAVFALEGKRVVDDVLQRCGLHDHAEAEIGQLSGGQRQRLFVALAWLNDPAVIFLDEMTQGLDAEARSAVWRDVKARQGSDCTVVLVSHFADELEALCDRVGVLAAGQIVAVGTPAELIEQFGLRASIELTERVQAQAFVHLPEVHVHPDEPKLCFPPELLVAVCVALDRSGYAGSVTMRPPSLGDVLGMTAQRHPDLTVGVA